MTSVKRFPRFNGINVPNFNSINEFKKNSELLKKSPANSGNCLTLDYKITK